MSTQPAGWFPDPDPRALPGQQRYFDGTVWTEHVHVQAGPVGPVPATDAQAAGGAAVDETSLLSGAPAAARNRHTGRNVAIGAGGLLGLFVILGMIGAATDSGDDDPVVATRATTEDPVASHSPTVEQVTVPDVGGMTTQAAQDALAAAGLAYTLKNAGASTVVDQSPAAGKRVAAGHAVLLTLGLSPDELAAQAAAKKAADDAAAQAAAEAKAAADAQAAADAAAAEAARGTVAQQNAVRKAESYLEFTAFSRSGLIEQLEYEDFATADATWAVDHIAVDWNEQAALKAANYLDFTAFSRQGLIEQLEYEGFSAEQAAYGVSTTGL